MTKRKCSENSKDKNDGAWMGGERGKEWGRTKDDVVVAVQYQLACIYPQTVMPQGSRSDDNQPVTDKKSWSV